MLVFRNLDKSILIWELKRVVFIKYTLCAKYWTSPSIYYDDLFTERYIVIVAKMMVIMLVSRL